MDTDTDKAAENRERARAYNAAYRAKNKERARAYNAAYRAKNKERTRAYNAAYQAENKEALWLYQKAYRAKNKVRRRAYDQANKEQRLAANRQRKYGITPEDYNRMLTEQNHACKICSIEFNGNYNLETKID